jgi:hypothetical protein
MANNRKTSVDMSEVIGGLSRLGEAKEPVARSMGVAMGQTVRDEAKMRAPVLKPGNEGYDGQVEGTLRDNIYLAFDGRKHLLNPNTYTYTVSWNSFRAAHGHLMEFGFEQPYKVAWDGSGVWYTPLTGEKGAKGRNVGFEREGGPKAIEPQPFLGPAFDAKFNILLTVATEAGRKKFSEVVK